MKGFRHVRLTWAEAWRFVDGNHRHHEPPAGHLFSLGAARDGNIVGVVIVGRPVSRMRDDGETAEVTRLCTDGTKNACSFLYGCAARAAFALGFETIGTYTLPEEGGASLRAAGWKLLGVRGGGSWDRGQRPRVDTHPTQGKLFWERAAASRDRNPVTARDVCSEKSMIYGNGRDRISVTAPMEGVEQ